MATRKEIRQFILDNHKKISKLMMAERLGITSRQVKKMCEELGVVPMGIYEYNLMFIKEHCHKLSRSQMAAVLKMTAKSLWQEYALIHEIKFLPDEQANNEAFEKEYKVQVADTRPLCKQERVARDKEAKKLSPRAILADYRLTDAHHHFELNADPVSEERAKLRRDLQIMNIKLK